MRNDLENSWAFVYKVNCAIYTIYAINVGFLYTKYSESIYGKADRIILWPAERGYIMNLICFCLDA